MKDKRRGTFARQIIAYPANVPCPICGGVVQDWHTEWTDPAHAPDFYKGLRVLDCPICGGWVLYKAQKIQAVPAGDSPQRAPSSTMGEVSVQGRAIFEITWIKRLPGSSTRVTSRLQRSRTLTPMLRLTRGIRHGAY